jgi:2,3-bisphosphoglycerate-independent phosphoglycerate mutase
MEESTKIISQSKTIKSASAKYRGNPTSAWLWGGGRRPNISTLKEKFGLTGHTISAVDLIHGIGRAAGLTPIPVEGATGYIDTNYEGKISALKDALKSKNFVYLHVEAPDESGHEGDIEHKLKAIQDFDAKIIGPALNILSDYKDYALLVMPDHPTPITLKTHTADPVPFCMMRTGGFAEHLNNKHAKAYNEFDCSQTGLFIEDAHRLIELMIAGNLK